MQGDKVLRICFNFFENIHTIYMTVVIFFKSVCIKYIK